MESALAKAFSTNLFLIFVVSLFLYKKTWDNLCSINIDWFLSCCSFVAHHGIEKAEWEVVGREEDEDREEEKQKGKRRGGILNVK